MAKNKVHVTEKLSQVLVAPVVTEKSSMAAEGNSVVFKISEWADKTDVKAAVEALYGVEVLKVNTLNIKGKTKRFRGMLGRRSDIRKAVVRIKDGQSIDLGTNV